MSALALKTLVLNADYRPLSVYPISLVSVQDALRTVYRDRATVVDEWDAVLRTANFEIKVPKVIALRAYAPISSVPKFCRRSVYLRDRFRCQYCGEKFGTENLTFDHVTPRAAGGQTVWTNILTACVDCNAAKRDQMPQHSGRKGKKGTLLRPLKAPRQPTTAELLRAGMECMDPAIKEDFHSWLYWNVPLDA